MPLPKLTKTDGGGLYYEDMAPVVTFPSGSTLLDLVNGGGWPIGRTVNLCGDKSTGKTQLAIEAVVNFRAKFPGAPCRYIDAESAFDKPYARVLGFPGDVTPARDVTTMEEFGADVIEFTKDLPDGGQALYMLDSLDALADDAELEREFGAASYGGAKAKLMSQFFRDYTAIFARKGVTLFIVSQLRDKLGVVYGRKECRSGGRALDFAASQIVWLTHVKRLHKTRDGIERPVGVIVQAKNEKNKVGTPFQDCKYPIMFRFGVDDVVSMLDWIVEAKRTKQFGQSIDACKKLAAESLKMNGAEWRKLRLRLRKFVRPEWKKVDDLFDDDDRRKYP